MNLLQKLNLEPGAELTMGSAVSIVAILAENRNRSASSFVAMLLMPEFQSPETTNTEFLAACEEWLANN